MITLALEVVITSLPVGFLFESCNEVCDKQLRCFATPTFGSLLNCRRFLSRYFTLDRCYAHDASYLAILLWIAVELPTLPTPLFNFGSLLYLRRS